MEEKDVVIKVDGIKKKYKLGRIGAKTLGRDILTAISKIRKTDDPNTKIGEKGGVKWALDGVSFTVNKGERLGIIGKNGAGKTTLLKLISRITYPTEGEIRIDGRISSLLEIGTGFNAELTGRENIYLNGVILGMKKSEIDEKLSDIIEFSECGEFIDTPVKRYSSGMIVRLAFAVAVNLNSEIVIMDEVLAVGDIAFQKKCLNKMREISENQDKTVLYVSHNMDTIRTLCDRCIVLDNGKIVYDGDSETAITKYTEICSN